MRAIMTTILITGSTIVMSFGLFAVYGYSIYEAYSLNGAKGLFTIIPIFGQLIWAGVKLQSSGFFNTYYYLIYITVVAYGVAHLATYLSPLDSTEEYE